MAELIRKPRFYIPALGIAMAALGFLLAVAGTTAFGSKTVVSDRLVIAYNNSTAVEAFPTTADAAVAAG